jgi:hypothetical protein
MSQRFTSGTQITAASWSFDTSQPWSICGWLYLVASSAGDGDLFFSVPSATPTTSNSIRLGYSNNGSPTLRWRTGNGSISLGNTAVAALGQWYHMALTYDGTTARAYLDGSQVTSQALAMTDIHNQNDFGDFSFGTATAEYAQVKVWNGHCLTVGELANEKAYWTPQTDPAHVYAWWQFDASAPTLDSSGNSHTLSGPGTSNGSFTPPGQLNPDHFTVAAIGGTLSNGTAVVRTKLRVAASGATASNGSAWVATSVPTIGGAGSSVGGRARLKRGRR